MQQSASGTPLAHLGTWLEGTRRRPLIGYPVAVALFLLALLTRFGLEGVLPPTGFPFLTFFPAVIVAAFVGGLLPGLLCSALSILAAWFVFVPPFGSFEFATPADGVALAFFAGILVVDCTVIHGMNRALERNAVLTTELSGREATMRQERDELWRLVPDLLMTGTLSGQILTLNPAWHDVLGYREEDLLARPFWELINPDTLHLSVAAVEAMRRGETAQHTNCIRAANGTWRWFDWVSTPVGEVFHAVARDVTAQREREIALRETGERLVHAQRMEALGELAGGIAHDFNNVLQAVLGGARLIEGKPADSERVRRLAVMIADAAARGTSVTRRLLAFSRRADLRAEVVDAAELLGNMREILAHTLGTGVEIRTEVALALPPLQADRSQLETVLVNLATNARDAIGGAGVIILSAAAETVAGDGRALKAGRYVRLSVADTGTGMDEATLARASEPFFTTKASGEGTGLGLSMARGFAEQSAGALTIESAPGRGTTIRLWFPAAERMLAASRPITQARPAGDGPIGIMLVDDETLVRKITAEGLEALGYAVLSFGSAAEALEALDAAEVVDLLVSDLSMPVMDGIALIREAQHRRPRLPAILLTGFATDAAELAFSGVVSGRFSLLRKPVEARALAERIAVLLEGT